MSDKTAVHIDLAHKRSDLPDIAEQEGDTCPKCGGELDMGYGMAGGGMGVYEYCTECGAIASKTEDAS